jgi:hypothetical protein
MDKKVFVILFDSYCSSAGREENGKAISLEDFEYAKEKNVMLTNFSLIKTISYKQ